MLSYTWSDYVYVYTLACNIIIIVGNELVLAAIYSIVSPGMEHSKRYCSAFGLNTAHVYSCSVHVQSSEAEFRGWLRWL